MASRGILKYVSPYESLFPTVDLDGHVLIFTHIPKSAGTSLDHVLVAMSRLRGLRFKRAMGTLYGIFLGHGKNDAATDFAHIPKEICRELDFLSGHLPFGCHRRLTRPFFYITLVREPIARLVSHFRFGVDRSGWSASQPFEDLFRDGRMIDNLQTRQLAGITDPRVPCTAASLDLAISNLRNCYGIAATTDGFDAVLKALIALFRWPDIAYSDRQVGTHELPEGELRTRAACAVERFFALDRELHTQVEARSTPWKQELFEGVAEGRRRQDQVLVTSPLFHINEQPFALMPASAFDQQLSPSLQGREIDLQFV